MKLSQAFIRLPLHFDVGRMQAEVAALQSSAWVRHPTGFEGNSAARLITVDGQESDAVGGEMRATPHLHQSPYLQQVLASFGTVWSRSRLMKLGPGAEVPEHSDLNYHWFHRVRVHIPIFTRPGVHFHCDGQTVHMAAGEAWIFDNWRHHRVQNATPLERVHLVADTTGSAHFWQLVKAGVNGEPTRLVPYESARPVSVLMERYNSFRVMPPAEMDQLLRDLTADTISERGDSAAIGHFVGLIDSFRADWRQLWSLYGDEDAGIEQYQRLVRALSERAQILSKGLQTRSNGLPTMLVLDARVLQHALSGKGGHLRRP
ncbi:MAG: aspartyl beta-hydroxylase [Nevskiaceae bacterium]|nr:MAG: aspartyl beta-hydroxylase [Nevskiaceae bacterium]TAM23071.1 MAG: aspartyl beta-hydroxylase [Nevskiaceae bacterium]